MKLLKATKALSFLAASALLSTSAQSFANEGGIGTGGGGVTKPAKVSQIAIQNVIENESLPYIHLYLNSLEEAYYERILNTCPKLAPKPRSGNEELTFSIDKKFFQRKENIFEKIRTASFIVNTKEPCLDANKNFVDASAVGYGINTICISTFSLSEKLNRRNYKDETKSLLLHELSHLSGTTEEEAVFIQDDFYGQALKWRHTPYSPEDYYGDIGANLGEPPPFSPLVNRFIEDLESGSGSCRSGTSLFAYMNAERERAPKYGDSRNLRAERLADLEMARQVIDLLKIFGCSVDRDMSGSSAEKARTALNAKLNWVRSGEQECSDRYKLASIKPQVFNSVNEAVEILRKVEVVMSQIHQYEKRVLGESCFKKDARPTSCNFPMSLN